jgi:hypothetical protein
LWPKPGRKRHPRVIKKRGNSWWSIPLAELPATVNVITEDFLEDTRAYDIEDV